MKDYYVDCHCHIDFYKDGEIKGIVEKAKEKEVIILNAGVNVKTNRRILEIAEKYGTKVSLGLYPIDALKMSDKEIDSELVFIEKNKDKIIAIGEVGMDFKEDDKEPSRQEEIFRKIIKLARKLDLPLIVHSRKAEKECLGVLESEKAKKVVMHCFNGNFKLIQRIVDNGWMITIPTNVVFSEHFQKVIGLVPIEQLLCETDSPYLHPLKERNNVPANVIESYGKIAEIKKISLDEARVRIFENYENLFG